MPGSVTIAAWTLRIAVMLQCVGLWRIAFLDGTPIGTTLFMTLEVGEGPMLFVERGAAWLLVACGLSVLARPTRLALGFIAGWFALVAVLTWYQGGQFGSEYAVVAHATRIFAPLALATLVWPGSDEENRRLWAERLLRFTVAATFTTHGVEAIQQHPVFIDYVITAFRRIGFRMSEDATRSLLIAIGVQDLFLAALVATRRWRSVALYMAFWGAVTAGSRMVHMGFPKWPATIVRAANAGVPLALVFLWRPRDSAPTSDTTKPTSAEQEPEQ